LVIPGSSLRRSRFYRDIVFIACPPSTMAIPPVGIGYIAEHLRRLGYEAPIIDLNMRMYKEADEDEKKAWLLDRKNVWLQEKTLDKLLRRFAPWIDRAIDEALAHERYLIGFTVLHSREHLVAEMVRRIKDRDPSRLVLVGGPTLAPPRMRRDFTYICQYDFAVVGEGELATEQILERLRTGDGQDLMQVPGVIHHQPALSQDVAPHPPILPLDQLAYPRFHGLEPTDYAGQDPFPVVWSRGCTARCAFCESSRLWGKHRGRSPDSIHDEIRYITRRFKVHHLAPFDPIINGDLDALMEVATRLVREGPEIDWEGNFMASTRMTLDHYRTLQRAGCQKVYFGLETGSPAVLRAMKKPFSLQTAVRNILQAHEVGCEVYLNFITGYPGEGQQEFDETLEFLHEYADIISGIEFITECQIPEETDLYHFPDRYGLVFDKDFLGYQWSSQDGSNTYKVRQQRSLVLEREAFKLGIRSNPSTTLTDGMLLEDI
jgi:hypothetical protein